MGVANAGQNMPGDAWIFPGRIPAPQSTGAGQGTQGAQVTASAGDLATVAVVPVYESSQGELDMFKVDYNDTAGGSSDDPNLLQLTGQGQQSSAAWTASPAHVQSTPHPNNSGPGR